MAEIITTTFLLKRGTEEAWIAKNPILELGEPGFAYDKNLLKIGDGVTAWVDLQPANKGEFFVAPDGNSLIKNINGDFALYGFEDAIPGYLPVKSETGALVWRAIADATEDQKGLLKLYNAVGENTDGTMTQKAITDAINQRVKVSLGDNETLIFSYK